MFAEGFAAQGGFTLLKLRSNFAESSVFQTAFEVRGRLKMRFAREKSAETSGANGSGKVKNSKAPIVTESGALFKGFAVEKGIGWDFGRTDRWVGLS